MLRSQLQLRRLRTRLRLPSSRLAAAVRDPDVVARVLPHLPRPLVSRGSSEGERSRDDGWASPSSSAGRPTRVAASLSPGTSFRSATSLKRSSVGPAVLTCM